MDKPSRKSPRAQWIDYDAGLFFVTICAKNHIPYFGTIHNGEMRYSEIGIIVDKELAQPHIHHGEIDIPLYCVMPNHIHMMVWVKPDTDELIETIEQRCPVRSRRKNPDMARHVPTLSRYIASLKSAVSRQARKINEHFAWQTRYHDHLIRGHRDGKMITEYILNNPFNWKHDCFYTE